MIRARVPPSPDPDTAPAEPRRLRVFAIEPNRAQLDWSRLGPGQVRFRTDHAAPTVEIEADGGPGAVDLEMLAPDTSLSVTVDGAGVPGSAVTLRTRTLPHPPGEELCRIGSVNDLHIGEHAFGRLGTIVERPEPEVLHPVRCAHAAADALASWGAGLMLAKGDLTDSSRPEHWAEVAAFLEEVEAPVMIAPGNHETHRESTVAPEWEAARYGLRVLRATIDVRDEPGVRVITGDTAIDRTDVGRITHIADQILEAVSGTDLPIVLAVHHHFQPWRFPTHPPPGIPGPEARHFLDRLASAQPATLITSGHTHRHRMRRHGPLVLTEIGSTKDYPGTWAGYVVHEGGIRQVVRRIDEPSCIRWTEWSGRAALGLWRHWSPGTLEQRCFTHPWPENGTRALHRTVS